MDNNTQGNGNNSGNNQNNNQGKNNFAYNFSVLDNGLKVEFINLEYIEDFSVAIAWSDTDKDDYSTAVWFGADPYI